MEVVKEDAFKIQLRRIHQNKAAEPMSRSEVKVAIRLAQKMGLLGMGLGGEDGGRNGFFFGGGRDNRRDVKTESEPYFPELLELKWPPEGRLIEKDCTCDFWDRIGCKFYAGKEICIFLYAVLAFSVLRVFYYYLLSSSPPPQVYFLISLFKF